MKRTRIAVLSCTAVLCFALLVGAIWAAVVASFGINTKLTFNPDGVYVELSGQVYRGSSEETLEPLLDDPSYTLEPCKNYTVDENGKPSGSYSISEWTPAEILFLPSEKVVELRLNVTNKGEKPISVVPASELTLTNVTVNEDISEVWGNIKSNETKTYRLKLTAGDTAFSNLELNHMLNISPLVANESLFTITSDGTVSLSANYTDATAPIVLVVPETVGGVTVKKSGGQSGFAEKWNSKTKYVILPDCMEILDTASFYGSNNTAAQESLHGIILPKNLKELGSAALQGCTKLTSIDIPEGVATLGYKPFNSCSALSTAYINGQPMVDSFTNLGNNGGGLLDDAITIYIKAGLNTSSATNLIANFTKQSSSDKVGYDKWVKNS